MELKVSDWHVAFNDVKVRRVCKCGYLQGFPGERATNKNEVAEFVIYYVLCANLYIEHNLQIGVVS